MPPLQNEEIEKVSQSTVLKLWNHKWVVTTLFFFLSSVVIYFWKDIQIENIKQDITNQATEQITQHNQQMLKAFAKPLVWTVRAELLRGNVEEINIFTNDLVKVQELQMMNLVDNNGTIISSTNKNYESKPAADIYPPQLMVSDSITILPKSDKVWIVAAPVMSYDKRIGTLLLDYTPHLFVKIDSTTK
ncbi:MAG: hypothetical protein R2822_31200 [Spirosomataceae bacterium]